MNACLFETLCQQIPDCDSGLENLIFKWVYLMGKKAKQRKETDLFFWWFLSARVCTCLSCLLFTIFQMKAVMLCLWLADVHSDDCHVPGGLVPLLPGVPLGIIWWPQDYPCSHGYHRTTFCKVLHLLQPLHLCYCKQKVSVFFLPLCWHSNWCAHTCS